MEWFRKHCKKHYVSQLDRSDAMVLFAQGRKEFFHEESPPKNNQPPRDHHAPKRNILLTARPAK
jgi:hypothetical protein